MTTERKPAELFDPRTFVREEMAELRLTETYAESEEVPAVVIRWLASDAPVDDEIAGALSVMFGTSAQYWLNLQRAWEERG